MSLTAVHVLHTSFSSFKSSLKLATRALAYRNFRLFFLGQGFSLLGTWMQGVALGWMTYRLTGSPFLLGLVGFSGQVPAAVFAPFAGVMVDRWDRRRLLLATQSLAMALAFALAALAFTGAVAVWHIVVLSFFMGIINAFDIPGRQAFLLDMVESKEVLGNAIALQSSLFNSTRLMGPSAAGVLIALWGEGVCFFINGLSYGAIIAALLSMRLPPFQRGLDHPPVAQSLKEGFLYTYRSVPMRYILLLLSVTSLVGVAPQVLLPVFAKDVLRGGPRLLGFLSASIGAGALACALYLAMQKTVLGFGRKVVFCTLLFGGGLALFSFSKSVAPSMLLLLVVGFGMMGHMAASNTILQTLADDDKRGRVMSFYTLSFMGMAPIGSLLAGGLAGRFGAPLTVLLSGGVCLAAALLFARQLPLIRNLARPVYVRRGVMKEVTQGIEAASELMAPRED